MSISGVSPTKKTPLAPPHIPVLAGTDCSACHGAAYQAGGFGPATAMSAAKHAFVSTTCDTCHDTGKSFYVGSGTPLQLRPADHFEQHRSAHGDWRLLAVPHHHGLDQQRHAGRSHAESEQSHLRQVPHRGAERLHAGDPRGELGAAHRHRRQLRAVPRRHRHGADLVQQLHAQGCIAHACAHPVPCPAPTAAPATPRALMPPARSVR